MILRRVFSLLPLVALALATGNTNHGFFVHEGPQTDLASDDVITVCTGKRTEIQCREGSNIAITNAFWGRTSDKVCPSDDGDPVTDCQGSRDTKGLLKTNCENKRKCQLEARHAVLQQPGAHHCPGVNKYLVARYSCIPESQSVLLCNDVESELKCNAGWKMDVGEVFWGRQDHSQGMCLTEEVGVGNECPSTRFAENTIRQKCNGTSRCKVKASRDELEEPNKKHRGGYDCDGKDKYLKVTYFCRPTEYFDGTATEAPSSTGNARSAEGTATEAPNSTGNARSAEAPVEVAKTPKQTRKAAKKELLGALKEHIENLAKKKSEMVIVPADEKVKLVEALASAKDAAKVGFLEKKDTTPANPEKKEESTVKKAADGTGDSGNHANETLAKEQTTKDDTAKEALKSDGKNQETPKKEEEAIGKKEDVKNENAEIKKDDNSPGEEIEKAKDEKKEEVKPEEPKKEEEKHGEAEKKDEKKDEPTKTEEKKEEIPKSEPKKEEPVKPEEKKEEVKEPVKTEEKSDDAERSTVKSILARAREVLKNLDGESSFLRRKSLIDRNKLKAVEQGHGQKKSRIARIPRPMILHHHTRKTKKSVVMPSDKLPIYNSS